MWLCWDDRVRVLVPLLLASMVSSAGAATLSHTITLPSESVRLSPGPSGMTVSVADPAYMTLADPGSPELPFRVVSFVLPQGDDVGSFRAIESGQRVISAAAGLAVAGTARSEDGLEGIGAATASLAGAVYPSERARLLGVGRLHGYTIASFAVFPLRVENADLTASDRITLEVETVPSAQPAAVTMQRARAAVRQRARAELASLVVNPAAADAYLFSETVVPKPQGGFSPTSFPSLEGSAVDYVIVTPDSLAAAYQVLADFKTRKGVPTVVRTIEWITANYRNGSDVQETIRNFVVDA